MKQLLLMRHAKSDWSDPFADDHERPLNPRGRAAAPRMGEWMRGERYRPDVVLVSSSIRTLETLERMRRVMPGLPRASVERGLYHATGAAIISRLSSLGPEIGSVLLIGHQPGLGDAVEMLAAPGAPAECRGAFEHFPTAALAVMEASIADWSAIGPGSCAFRSFQIPRALA